MVQGVPSGDVETGGKYRDATYNIFKRFRVFSERVGPRILSLESVDYSGTSESSVVEKRRIFMTKLQ